MAPSTSRALLPQPESPSPPPLGESGLPLIWCPYCGMGRILELMSKSEANPEQRFFKCPRKYKKFPRCEFYMFEEEYANFLVNYGMLPESKMCHYQPLEMRECVEGIVQSEMYKQVKSLKHEPVGTTAAVDKKGGTKKKQRHMNWLICVGVAVLVMLGFNAAILLVLVLMQMFKR